MCIPFCCGVKFIYFPLSLTLFRRNWTDISDIRLFPCEFSYVAHSSKYPFNYFTNRECKYDPRTYPATMFFLVIAPKFDIFDDEKRLNTQFFCRFIQGISDFEDIVAPVRSHTKTLACTIWEHVVSTIRMFLFNILRVAALFVLSTLRQFSLRLSVFLD